jgi:transcriptional regulator with XRE-family HTH domain
MHDNQTRWLLRWNIRRRREEKRWSQDKLAERAGISVKYVQAIETGQRCPSIKVCGGLASAFGIMPFELFLPEQSGVEEETPLLLQGLTSEEKAFLIKSLSIIREGILALRQA